MQVFRVKDISDDVNATLQSSTVDNFVVACTVVKIFLYN